MKWYVKGSHTALYFGFRSVEGRDHNPPPLPIMAISSSLNMYVATSDSSIHVNIVVVSAVLALNTILTDTKKKVWFSGHVAGCKLKVQYSGHISRCRVAVLVETRSVTIGLLLHAQPTESTSNIY